MNEKIKQLAEQSGLLGPTSRIGNSHEATEKFAELIVKECVRECQREWYDLNNTDSPTDPRLVAILVGQKNGMLKAISRIKKHFGVD